MAYVGTPTSLSSLRDTLASVLAGEAGNQGTIGMTAVGAVIANRAATNFSGYGNTIQNQLLAANQFQGQSTPTAQSYAVADNILSGNYTDPTGGATSYANPSARPRHGRLTSIRAILYRLAIIFSPIINKVFRLLRTPRRAAQPTAAEIATFAGPITGTWRWHNRNHPRPKHRRNLPDRKRRLHF